MLDPKNGAVMKPTGDNSLNEPMASLGTPLWRAAADMACLAEPFRHLAASVSTWLERGAQRRRLQRLDDHMLKDMGITRCDVEREIRSG
jgi:uncharacterized protein YjiS (DUF1127 family)